jgi:hypothetical protein
VRNIQPVERTIGRPIHHENSFYLFVGSDFSDEWRVCQSGLGTPSASKLQWLPTPSRSQHQQKSAMKLPCISNDERCFIEATQWLGPVTR